MTASVSPPTHHGGVAILVRQKATGPAPNGNGTTVELTTVDEVLLENGRTLYQCAFPGQACWVTYDRPQSVISHQSTHSPVRVAERLLAEKAAQHENRSRGATAARAGIRERRQRVLENGLAATLLAEAEELEKRAQMLRAAAMRANELERATPTVTAEELTKLRADADELAKLRAILNGARS